MLELKLIGLFAEDEKGETVMIRLPDGVVPSPNLSESGIVNIPTPKDLKFEEEKEEAKDKTLDNILEKHKKDEMSKVS